MTKENDTEGLLAERGNKATRVFAALCACMTCGSFVCVVFLFRYSLLHPSPPLLPCEERFSPWSALVEVELPVPLSRQFLTQEELSQHPGWERYLVSVYGETLTFPIDTLRLSFFYLDLLNESGIDIPPAPNLRFEHVPFLHFRRLPIFGKHTDDSLWRNTYWYQGKSLPALPPDPFPSFSVVEVMHQPANEKRMMWHYVASGSGVFLDIGRTIVFYSHEQAEEEGFDLNFGRAQGYDTVQFLTAENFEIVDFRMRGRTTCPPPSLRHLFFSGWKASRPCICKEEESRLNCVK